MTIREYFIKYLCDKGMFQDQAEEVVNLSSAEKSLGSMKNRWNDDIEGYSFVILSATLWTINRVALEWIKENAPNVFYRPLFEPKEETK